MSLTICRHRVWLGNFPGHLGQDITDDMFAENVGVGPDILGDIIKGMIGRMRYGNVPQELALELWRHFKIEWRQDAVDNQ